MISIVKTKQKYKDRYVLVIYSTDRSGQQKIKRSLSYPLSDGQLNRHLEMFYSRSNHELFEAQLIRYSNEIYKYFKLYWYNSVGESIICQVNYIEDQ